MAEALYDYMLASQQNEITEHQIYMRLARATRDEANRRMLERKRVQAEKWPPTG